MISLDDLAQAAEELQKLGLDAAHEIVYGPRGYVEGLDVGEEFYPLWELHMPDNREALERLDFEAIRARRGPAWSIAPVRRSCAE